MNFKYYYHLLNWIDDTISWNGEGKTPNSVERKLHVLNRSRLRFSPALNAFMYATCTIRNNMDLHKCMQHKVSLLHCSSQTRIFSSLAHIPLLSTLRWKRQVVNA